MKLIDDGRFYSEVTKRIAVIYHFDDDNWGECDLCGKQRKNTKKLVYEDDEQGLEYCYGSECIKKMKFKKIA